MAYYHMTAVMRNVFVALSSRLKKIPRIKNLETGISETLHVRPNESSFKLFSCQIYDFRQ